jgi:hypothetical protein
VRRSTHRTVDLQATCPSCGKPVADDRDFCDSCGAYLRWDESSDDEQTAVLEPTPEPEAAADDAPTTAEEPARLQDAEPQPEAQKTSEEVLVWLALPGADAATAGSVETGVEPGSTAGLAALVRNRSGIVDHFDLEVRGLPPGWWTITPPTVHLVPFGSEGASHEAGATVSVHPPRSSEAVAGHRTIRVIARSRSNGVEWESNEALVRIAPFELFEGRLRPARVRATRTARYVLPVRNRGNAPLVLTPRGEDDDGEVRFAFEPARLEIPPGAEARSDVRATAPRLRSGPERTRNLTVHLEGGQQPLAGAAVFQQLPAVTRSRLTLWRVLLTLLAVALLVIASFAHWTDTETGLCTDGPDTCLRYDTYLERHLQQDVANPGDLGDFTRLFNFGTSLGVLTLFAAALILLGALTGRLAWFGGLFALAVLMVFAFTADESLGAGVWLGFLGAAAALAAAVLATAARRSG